MASSDPRSERRGFTTPRDLERPRFRQGAADSDTHVHRSSTATSMFPHADVSVKMQMDDSQPKRYSAPPRLNFDEVDGSSASYSDGSDDEYFESGCKSSGNVVLKPNSSMSMQRSEAPLLTIQENGHERATSEMSNLSSNSCTNSPDGFWEDVPGVDAHFKCNPANGKVMPELQPLLGVWSDMLGSTYIVSAAEWHGDTLSVTTIRDGGASRYTNNLIRCRRRCGEPHITWGQGYELEATTSKDKLIWAPVCSNNKPFYWLRRYECGRNDSEGVPTGKEHMRHPYIFGQMMVKQYRKSGCWPNVRKEIKLISRKQKELLGVHGELDEKDWNEGKVNKKVSLSSVITAVPDDGDHSDDTPRSDTDTDGDAIPRGSTTRSRFRPCNSYGTGGKVGTRRREAGGSLSGHEGANRISISSVMSGAAVDDVSYEKNPGAKFDDRLGCDVCITCCRPWVTPAPIDASGYIATPSNVGSSRVSRRRSPDAADSSLGTKRKREK